MSEQSNNQGRAYEYIFINVLCDEINKVRPAKIENNSAFIAAKRACDSMSENFKQILIISARSAVFTIFDMEPNILEINDDLVVLKIQIDNEGQDGDVRDIVISRADIKWEIGISLKHNHFAVKHSRLATNLDFGKKWFGIPCSKKYWKKTKPIFEFLDKQKAQGVAWRDVEKKSTKVYKPLLIAFMKEIKKSNKIDNTVPQKMVEYLLGEFDFYKVISVDSKKLTQIQTYNLHGTLNKPSRITKPKITVPIATLPTRIINIGFKPDSDNTIELYLDNGWQFSFRIHNASTLVEPSLKFDIQIIGMPTTIISIDCRWQ